MFEQAIRFAAEMVRHSAQAVLDTLDSKRTHVDSVIDDVLWEEYLRSSNDCGLYHTPQFTVVKPQPEYDLDQLNLIYDQVVRGTDE